MSNLNAISNKTVLPRGKRGRLSLQAKLWLLAGMALALSPVVIAGYGIARGGIDAYIVLAALLIG